jgi:hypothetical protein
LTDNHHFELGALKGARNSPEIILCFSGFVLFGDYSDGTEIQVGSMNDDKTNERI